MSAEGGGQRWHRASRRRLGVLRRWRWSATSLRLEPEPSTTVPSSGSIRDPQSVPRRITRRQPARPGCLVGTGQRAAPPRSASSTPRPVRCSSRLSSSTEASPAPRSRGATRCSRCRRSPTSPPRLRRGNRYSGRDGAWRRGSGQPDSGVGHRDGRRGGRDRSAIRRDIAGVRRTTFQLRRTITLPPMTVSHLRDVGDGTVITAGSKGSTASTSTPETSSGGAKGWRCAPTSPSSPHGQVLLRQHLRPARGARPRKRGWCFAGSTPRTATPGRCGRQWRNASWSASAPTSPSSSRWRLDGSGPITRVVAPGYDPVEFSPNGERLIVNHGEFGEDFANSVVDVKTGDIVRNLGDYQRPGLDRRRHRRRSRLQQQRTGRDSLTSTSPPVKSCLRRSRLRSGTGTGRGRCPAKSSSSSEPRTRTGRPCARSTRHSAVRTTDLGRCASTR